jgi:hypothetical protein
MDALVLAERFCIVTWPAPGDVCFPEGPYEEELEGLTTI